MPLISIYQIRFRFHPLFVIVMIASILTGYFVELITLFGIVFIHEMGHVLMAYKFKWRITEVQLLPFGGVMSTEEQGTIPAHEDALVALAGPMMNGVLIVIALCMQHLGWWHTDWSHYFVQANMLIAGFNLLPILPLDGGRVMQAMLSLIVQYYRSIFYCTWLSIIVSGMLTVYAIASWQTAGIQLNLLMIGLFMFYANIYQLRHIPYHFIRFLMHRELRAAQLIGKGVLASPIVVQHKQRLKTIVHMFMRERYHLIYVMNERHLIQAVLSEKQIIDDYLMEKKKNRVVSDLFMIE